MQDQDFDIELATDGEYVTECEDILRALPDWFGIEEAIIDYVEQIPELTTWMARRGEQAIGFLSVEMHTEQAAEITVMGVYEDFQRLGVGRALLEAAEEGLRRRGIEFLQVKTLSAARRNEAYEKTRRFYETMGFVPLQEFPTLWDPANPCLQFVKSLGTQRRGLLHQHIIEFQRQCYAPDDPEWLESVETLRDALDASDDALESLRLKGRLGDQLRACRETVDDAVELLQEAVAELDSRGEEALVASNLIRLATALQYTGEHQRALAVFDRAVEIAGDHDLLDYAHQHLGKCLVELGEFQRARRHFEKALKIRRRRGDQSLVESTCRALDGLEESMEEVGRK